MATAGRCSAEPTERGSRSRFIAGSDGRFLPVARLIRSLGVWITPSGRPIPMRALPDPSAAHDHRHLLGSAGAGAGVIGYDHTESRRLSRRAVVRKDDVAGGKIGLRKLTDRLAWLTCQGHK